MTKMFCMVWNVAMNAPRKLMMMSGLRNGIEMCHNLDHGPAPSRSAASYRSSGTPWSAAR